MWGCGELTLDRTRLKEETKLALALAKCQIFVSEIVEEVVSKHQLGRNQGRQAEETVAEVTEGRGHRQEWAEGRW